MSYSPITEFTNLFITIQIDGNNNILYVAIGSLVSILGYYLFLRIRKHPFSGKAFYEGEVEHFKTIIENLPDAVYIKDLNSKYVVANHEYRTLVKGRFEGDITGLSDFDIFTEEEATSYFSDDQLILRGKKELIKKEDELKINGNTHYLDIRKTGIKNKKGRIIGIVGTISDVTPQKRSSLELIRKNEQLTSERNLLRALLDNVPDVIYIKDKNFKFLDGNPSQVKVTKAKNRDELIGKTDYDFYPKDIADIFSNDDRSVIETGESIVNKEEIGFDPEGNIRIISTTKVPFYSESGEVAGLVGIGRDITKLKETEEKLKEQAQSLQEINILLEERQEEINQQSEELANQNAMLENEKNLLRTLIDTIPDYIYIKDKEGAFLTANRHLMNNFGFKHESEILGKTDHDLFPETYASQYAKDERNIIDSGKPIISNEEPTIDSDGNVIYILTTKVPYVSPNGEVLGIIGVGRDITNIKEAELKFKEQANHLREVNVLLEERQEEIQQQSTELTSQNRILENERNLLRTIIDNIPDLIFVKDTESRYVTANQATIELTGVGSLENLIGKSDYDIHEKSVAAKYFEDDKNILKTKTPLVNKENKVEIVMEGQESVIYFSSTKVPFFDADNRIIGIVAISRDITERKMAHEKLREQANHLVSTNELLEERQSEIEKQSEDLQSQNHKLTIERNLMRALIDHMPDYIYVKDKESRFLLANSTLLKVMHVESYEDLLGKTDFDFATFTKTAMLYFKDEQNIIKTGNPIINKAEVGFDEEGRERIISTTKVPFRDANGNVMGIVGIGRDITKIKNAEKQLREQTENL
ncbi:MAG: PAS domain-containing protein, partial [Bacteroidales bacterium]|nr:PAS domain-containing protein [Bacteroidales bacterium]